MNIIDRIKYPFQQLSPRAVREIIIAAVILCLAFVLSIPAFVKDMEEYRSRKTQDDGLKTSAPELQGMDPQTLAKAGKYLGSTAACSLIIARHNRIVYENYFEGSAGQYNNVYSVTKSVISALTGIAIENRMIGGTGDKLERYLPDYFKYSSDPRWKDITIKQLLTMTPGFCEDLNSWTGSADWLKSAFQLPLNYPPGERFQYANSAVHILSAVLTDATGMDTRAFADKYLFNPLKITEYKWEKDPQGIYTGFSSLYLRPRDMAKLGLMYLDGGKWEGRQVVPKPWVEESSSVQYDFNKEDPKPYENAYGFLWWINGETGHHMYSALGYGGQSINVIPDLDMVVVMTANPDNPLGMADEIRMELLKQYVIPAVFK